VKKLKSNEKGFGAVEALLIVVIVVLIGVVGWVVYKNHNNKSTPVSSTTSVKTKTIQVNKVSPIIETDKATDGYTISYPLTVANANVMWWSADGDNPSTINQPASPILIVSDKSILQFLSSIPFDTRQTVCGDNALDQTAIQMGRYDMSAATLTLHNQYQNCIAAFASSNGGQYQTQAQQVLNSSTSDINAWAKSLKITH
jgi:hypothetical protein